MKTTEQFKTEMGEYGWSKFEGVFNTNMVNQLNEALAKAYDTCRTIQLENGVAVNTDGTVHHLLGQDAAFLEVIKQETLFEPIRSFFDHPFILNSFGGVINMKNKLAYVGNMHRDIRTFYHIPMMLNMLILLDDFTLDNGATYLLSGSHQRDVVPDKDHFYKHSDRLVGKAGDIVLFDSLLWHATGENFTDKERRALTLTFTRPFMKQQLDYPRLLGYEKGDSFTEPVRQVLGYNARVPSSLQEWYQPAERRFYKQGQG